MKRKFLEYNFGYEVKWQEIKSDKTQAAIHAILDENKAKHGVYHAESGLFGFVDNKDLANTYSAAVVALNAITETKKPINAIIEKMPNGKYWILGMITSAADEDDEDQNDDEPNQLINGFDTIVDKQELIAEVDELVGIINEADFDFKYLADKETAKYIESEIGIAATEVGGFEDLLKDVDNVKSILKDAKIKTYKGLPIALIGIGIAVVGGLAVVMNISSGNKSSFDDPFANVAQDVVPMVKKSKSAKEVEKELLEAAYAEEIRWLTNDFKKQDSVKLVSALVKMHQQVPQFIAGWKITEFSFDAENPKLVIAKAKRTVFGTPVTLKEGASGYERINLIGNNDAEIVYRLPDIKRDTAINDVINHIKQGKYKTIEMAHDSHYLGLAWDVYFVDTTTRKEKIQGIKDKKKSTASQLQTTAKGFIVKGRGVEQLQASQLMLSKANTTIIKKVTLDRINGVNWLIEGTVYER